MKLELQGTEKLVAALQAKSETDFEKVRNKSLLEMRNRAVKTKVPSKGGTPVGDYVGGGQLRLSAGVDVNRGYMGYTKDYAPHVEYGHRTRNGGFVYGQYFLKNNLRIQGPKFKRDLKGALEND